MASTLSIIPLLQVILLSTVIFLTLVYSISLLIFQRLRHRLHIFTINVCAGILCSCTYWLVNNIMRDLNPAQLFNIETCSLVYYAQTMCTLQVVLAILVASIHRLCCIVYYNKAFLQSKKWTLMCVGCQWLVGILIALPAFIRNGPICALPYWMKWYTLVVIIVIPISLCLVINIMIFKYVRSSTRRIHPATETVSTVDRNNAQPTLSRRDIHLLRHMVIMFLIFFIGWCPVYVTSVIGTQVPVSTSITRILSLFAELSLLCDIVDLYLYSHELRRQLLQICQPRYYQ